MSFAGAISLLFKEPKGTIDVIVFDAVLSESHDLQNDVTDHPVEPGSGIAAAADAGRPASVSDNVRRKPDVITISGIVSNTPANGPGAFLGVPLVRGVIGVGASVASGTNILDAVADVENSIASKAFDSLVALRDEGRLVEVVTKFKKYKNMVITSLNVNQDVSIGNCLSCTVTLREVRLVQSVFVNIPVAPKISRAKKSVSKGNQPGNTPTTAKEDKGRSILDHVN